MKVKRRIPLALYAAACAAVIACFAGGVHHAQHAADAEGLRIAQTAVERAAVACYATEGRYPQSYAYLRQHYGVRVDESKYIVHYEIFAENIMPDITVTEKGSST